MSSSVPNNLIVNEVGPNYVIVNEDVANNVVINEDVANRVIVEQDAPNQVVVRLSGPGAGLTRRKVHSQGAASSEWIISHTLGGRPSVTVVDSAGTVVMGEVTYTSDSQVTVNFTAPFSGFAYLT